MIVIEVPELPCSVNKAFANSKFGRHKTAAYKEWCRLVERHIPDGKCLLWDAIDYDIRDPKVRGQLQNLKFICNVGGKRYRIADGRPGLTSNSCQGGTWIKKCKVLEADFISIITDYQRLIDAGTVCAAQDSEYGESLFLSWDHFRISKGLEVLLVATNESLRKAWPSSFKAKPVN